MTEIKPNKILYNGILLIFSAITAYVLFLIYLNLNKGFELSDESYYGLATQYPLQTRTFASCFGVINSKFCFGNYDLYSLRLFKFVYQIIALISFCTALYFYVNKKFPEKSKVSIIGLFMIFLSGFLNYDYLPQTLSYNSWSLIFSLMFFAFFLLICIIVNKKIIYLLNCLLGFSLTVLFYSKLPNAIILLIFFVMYHLFFMRKTILVNLLGVVTGSIMTLFILFGSVSQVSYNTTNMLNDIFYVSHTSIGAYFEQIYAYLFQTMDYKLVAFEILALVSLFFLKSKYKIITGFIIVFANIIFSFKNFEGNSNGVENDFSFLLLLCMSTFVLYFLFRDKDLKIEFKKELFFILALVFTPILLAMGTNNSLFYTGSQLMVFGVAAVVILLLLCRNNIGLLALTAFCMLTAIFLLNILNHGMISTPYRQSSLLNKNLPLYFSETNHKIYENHDRFVLFYTLSKKIIKNNPDHFPICAEFSYVGAAYLTGNRTLPFFWLPDPGYGYKKVKESFKTIKFTNENMFVLISSKNAADANYLQILRENNLDLNGKLKLCDSLYVNYNKEYIYFYKTM